MSDHNVSKELKENTLLMEGGGSIGRAEGQGAERREPGESGKRLYRQLKGFGLS